MPDLSIPQLDPADLPLTGSEITVVSQAGVAKSVTIFFNRLILATLTKALVRVFYFLKTNSSC